MPAITESCPVIAAMVEDGETAETLQVLFAENLPSNTAEQFVLMGIDSLSQTHYADVANDCTTCTRTRGTPCAAYVTMKAVAG